MGEVRSDGARGLARRAAQLAVAVAVIVAAAILARPPDVTVTSPFEVERQTPSPAPQVAPTPAPAEPEPPPRAGIRLGVVAADTDTLAPAGDRIELGVSHSYLASDLDPAGRWLAVATGEADGTSVLQLVDVARLGTPSADFPPPARFLPAPEPLEQIPVPATVERLRFAPTAGELVWLGRLGHAPDVTRAARGVGVVRFDEDALQASFPPAVELPGDFEPAGLAPLGDGRVGVFGYELPPVEGRPSRQRRALGAVRLFVADVGSGELTADLIVLAPDASQLAPLADVAWDPQRDRAYVAGAGGAVTVVDLAEGVAGTQLRPPDATPPPAEAGGALDPLGSGGWRDAVLSPDGTRLYVGGTRPGRESSGQGPPRPARLPLAVFDTEAEAPVDLGNTPRGRIVAVSPDGDRLAVVTGAPGPEGPQSLLVLDAATLEERWRRPLDGVGLVEVEFAAGADRLVTVHPERAPRPAARLTALDGATGEVLATRAYDGLPVGMFPATGVLVLFGRG